MDAVISEQAPAPPASGAAKRSTRWSRVVLVGAVLAVLLVVGLGWSLTLGSTAIGVGTIVAALFHGNSTSALIVRTLRLPRALLSALVGANLGVAGTVMQGVTSNPLAAPELLGVSAGAAAVVVTVTTAVPALSGVSTVILAFTGATAAALVVMLLAGAGRGRTSQVRLVLAGVTVTLLLLSLTQGLVIFHENSTDAVFFWLVGGVNFAQSSDVITVLPWTCVGLIGAIALAGPLNLLALGEDVARGLGQKVERTRILGAVWVVVLAGASVAVAGPIAFIGLVVPHIVRRMVGNNHYVVLPLSALGGATLLVYADIVSRYVDPPAEVPAGVITALLGAPVFVYLSRRAKAIR